MQVAIHNKNGQGLLLELEDKGLVLTRESQSTIKMDKGYYFKLGYRFRGSLRRSSQSTIKMDKGYYIDELKVSKTLSEVAIHNKNGEGLLLRSNSLFYDKYCCRNPQ